MAKELKPGAASAAFRHAIALVWLACASVVGCSSGSQTGSGQGGAPGQGGSVGQGGAGGNGSPATGGAVGTGGRRDAAADTGPATGSCALPEKGATPTDCTDFTAAGAFCAPERGIAGDGGIYVPGGDFVVPTGGTIVDGDYDLVHAYGSINAYPDRRTLRIFDAGGYIEWSIDYQNPPSDGGITHYRFNTMGSPSGGSLGKLTTTCIPSAFPDGLDYSANGTELDIIDLYAQALFVYQRRCTR